MGAIKTGLLASLALAALSACGTMADLRAPMRGDARLAYDRSLSTTNIMFAVELPEDNCHAFTVCGWFRLVYSGDRWITTAAFYCPENIQRSNPDLMAGAAGYPADGNLDGAAGTNLTTAGGTITAEAFPWQPYAPGTGSSNAWPRGVYTLAGWTSNELTVSLGGSAVTLAAGAFNRNAVPGVSNEVIVTGSGPVCLGISRTPDAEFYMNVDGVVTDQFLTADSIVTNEISFCAWRFKLTDTDHVYQSNLVRLDANDCLGHTQTNAMPRRARAFSAHGYYRIGFMGAGSGQGEIGVDMFDVRVIKGLLTDAELCRIHENGVQEIRRRGVPQWK